MKKYALLPIALLLFGTFQNEAYAQQADSVIHRLLENNCRWVTDKQYEDSLYFHHLAEGQHPVALLVGCSDSRVSPEVVLGADLGSIFVHRNIANIVSHSDLNFLSVMQYAVDVLQVDHVIVYGHYGCGGVKAAMEDEAIGLIDNWLANIKDVIALHHKDMEDVEANEHEHFNRLVEINVLNQIENLKETSVYRQAIKSGRNIRIHGWVYDFSSGKIKVLTPEVGIGPREHCDFQALKKHTDDKQH
jgi:carbonic anhydrase